MSQSNNRLTIAFAVIAFVAIFLLVAAIASYFLFLSPTARGIDAEDNVQDTTEEPDDIDQEDTSSDDEDVQEEEPTSTSLPTDTPEPISTSTPRPTNTPRPTRTAIPTSTPTTNPCTLISCGDGTCQSGCGEDKDSCLEDCHVCGDDICERPVEDQFNCGADCIAMIYLTNEHCESVDYFLDGGHIRTIQPGESSEYPIIFGTYTIYWCLYGTNNCSDPFTFAVESNADGWYHTLRRGDWCP